MFVYKLFENILKYWRSKTQIIVERGGVTKSIIFKFLNSLELTSWPAVVLNIILTLIINHYLETFDLLKSCSWLAEFLIWQPSSSLAHTRSRAPLKKVENWKTVVISTFLPWTTAECDWWGLIWHGQALSGSHLTIIIIIVTTTICNIVTYWKSFIIYMS